MRRDRGFSLVELLIVLGVAVVLIAIGGRWLDSERKRVARGDAISVQATEMATLGRALGQYLRERTTSVPTDDPLVVSFEELQESGFLPEEFAVKDQFGTAPASPLGQQYILLAKSISGQPRGLVLAMGAPAVGALARPGIRPSQEDLIQHNSQVTRVMRQVHFVAAALIRVGSAEADRQVSGFAFDFSPFIDAMPQSTAVVLTGYQEFSSTPEITVRVEGGGGAGGGDSSNSSECSTIRADQTCPSGTTEAFSWEACDSRAQNSSGGVMSINGPFGNVILTMQAREHIELSNFANIGSNASGNCAGLYGVEPYLRRYGQHYSSYDGAGNYTYYGNDRERQSFGNISNFTEFPIAGFQHNSSSSSTFSSGVTTHTGSCAINLGLLNNIKRSSHTCAAMTESNEWEPLLFAEGNSVPLGVSTTGNYRTVYNASSAPHAIGWRRSMTVSWNGQEIARTSGCSYGLPVDQQSGPWTSAWWRSELNIGSQAIQPPCPAKLGPGNAAPTRVYAATRVFNVSREGGGKICCS
ncbi:type II secretion system protein [Luteimonas sp. MHLX1A]|uniref:type II secretion system protein n=1 Tax=Alterluteimonas muca TaxID=2878684 RepID=UPI00210431B8|nr:prepilin-type N-terminal cleavage/methylation domain-containing protein [Luteimonas sp. MHLX1A]MCD9046773.1 prepilin-type N-terminal cleavage/methylation domain-containing protein [Luteimonas sp. MHLX1A]